MGNRFYGLVLVLACQAVIATEPTSVTSELEAGRPLSAVVAHARDSGLSPLATLTQLTDAGVDLVKAVQTISREWRDCEATYAVAGAGARQAPLRADEIAAAIATLRSCQCDAKSLWAKTRINRRLRPEIHRVLVSVGDVCSCAAAGIEATVEAVPDQAENVIEAVISAKNAPDNTADSFGQVGVFPESGQWQSPDNPAVRSRQANLMRRPDWCRGDANPQDAFDPARQWLPLPLADMNSLGQHEAACKAQSDTENNEKTGNSLILSQYYEGPGHNQALEFYNPTDHPIRLSAEPYETEIYFHGYAVPGEVLRLKGVVPPRSTFVVVNALADNPQLKAKADQVVFGLNFAGADAVVLKNRLDWNNCDCAVTSVAASLRATGGSQTAEAEKSTRNTRQESQTNWIERLKHQYAHGDTPALVVDAVGELPLSADTGDENAQVAPPALHRGTWQRKPVVCFGDRTELDPFEPASQWRVLAEPVLADLGRHRLDQCPETPPELLLSELVIGDEANQALEIYNATPEPVDFSRQRYVLEIYHDDNLVPDQRIDLSGQLAPGATWVLANANADEPLLAKAGQTVNGLRLDNSYSVVLRRVVAPAWRACYAEVASWLRKDPDPNYLSYIPVLVTDPFIGPQSGDDPRDGDRGGDLASPN